MTVRELMLKLNELIQTGKINPNAIVLGAGDEDAGAINDVSYFPHCTEEELPYDGGGMTDDYLGKDILVLYGDWN